MSSPRAKGRPDPPWPGLTTLVLEVGPTFLPRPPGGLPCPSPRKGQTGTLPPSPNMFPTLGSPCPQVVRSSCSASVDWEPLRLSSIVLPKLGLISLVPSHEEGRGIPESRKTGSQAGRSGRGQAQAPSPHFTCPVTSFPPEREQRPSGKPWVGMKGASGTPWPSSRRELRDQQNLFSLGTEADPLCSRTKGVGGQENAPKSPPSGLLTSWVPGEVFRPRSLGRADTPTPPPLQSTCHCLTLVSPATRAAHAHVPCLPQRAQGLFPKDLSIPPGGTGAL